MSLSRCRAWDPRADVDKPGCRCRRSVPNGDAFYVPPQPLEKAKPGTIIRSTPIAAPAGGVGVEDPVPLQAVDGNDIAVSGWWSPPPARRRGRTGGGDLGAGATGLADSCAPSKQPDIASGASGVGIGYPRHSSRCCKHSSTRAMWSPLPTTRALALPACTQHSSARARARRARRGPAARGLKAAAARNKALVFGLSQGGHAALFAGELAASTRQSCVCSASRPWRLTRIEQALRQFGYVLRSTSCRDHRRGLPRRVPRVRPRCPPHTRCARESRGRRPEMRHHQDVLAVARARARAQPARHSGAGDRPALQFSPASVPAARRCSSPKEPPITSSHNF